MPSTGPPQREAPGRRPVQPNTVAWRVAAPIPSTNVTGGGPPPDHDSVMSLSNRIQTRIRLPSRRWRRAEGHRPKAPCLPWPAHCRPPVDHQRPCHTPVPRDPRPRLQPLPTALPRPAAEPASSHCRRAGHPLAFVCGYPFVRPRAGSTDGPRREGRVPGCSRPGPRGEVERPPRQVSAPGRSRPSRRRLRRCMRIAGAKEVSAT